MIEDAIDAQIDGDYKPLTEGELLELAESQGCRLVLPSDNLLLLDLDTDEAEKQYRNLLDLAGKIVPIKNTQEWKSKSGHLHVRVELEAPAEPMFRLLLSACLGSDPKRELLHLHELTYHGKPNICLFQPK